MADNNRRMTAVFHHMELTEGPTTFEQLLEQAHALDAESRIVELNDVPFRLETLEKKGGFYQGDFIRIRKDFHPGKVKMAKLGVEDIGLDEDEHISEETAFLYVPGMSVLVLQRNPIGMTAKMIATYILRVTNFDGALLAAIVFETEHLRRLAKINLYKSVSVGVGRASGAVFKDLGLTGKALTDLCNDAGAPVVEVTAKMGHSHGALTREWLDRVVKGILRLATGIDEERDAVKKLRVTGQTDVEEMRVIDLLEPHMYEVLFFQSDDRRVPYPVRVAQLKKAWQMRQQELQQQYSHGQG